MITEKQKCIAEQAVYGDLLVIKSGQETEMERRLAVTLERVLVLRPLSDLTVEITHKGYNDDKPFIPRVELAKAYFPNCIKYKMGRQGYVFCERSSDVVGYNFNKYSEERLNLIKEELDLLHLWHFDTRNLIEKGEAVDVNTLAQNPYII